MTIKPFALTILLAFAVPASADTNFFAIMPWNHAPNDPAVLKRIKDCGFNMAGFVTPASLDNVHAAGLKGLVYDNRCASYNWESVDGAKAREQIVSLVNEVNQHPAVFGYYLRDEPTFWLFPGLNKVAAPIQELAPGKWPYINLFPDYATPGQLGTKDYAEYLEKFITMLKPSIVSYDNYSLMDDGSLRPNYWTNIEAVRAATKKHGIVFWNIVLATSHFHYREVTAADLRFQAYTTVAYGGRGISYFTYFAPPVGNFRNAPVDQFGNETQTWQWLQTVNMQIQKLAPALVQLTSDDVYHLTENIPTGCKGLPETSLVAAIPGNDFVVGEFTHRDGSRYLMVVNRSVTKSRHCYPQFRKPPKRLLHISPYTGTPIQYDGEYTWLSPGAGVLLKPEW